MSTKEMYFGLQSILDQEYFGEKYLDQDELDLHKGRNTNPFSYKGQFSPDFISNLLKYYAHKDALILDPFVGSGTVLFEAARRGLTAYGTEINPAAYEMANTISFIGLSIAEREEKVANAMKYLSRLASSVMDDDLYKFLESKIEVAEVFEKNILKNAYISLLASKRPHTSDSLKLYIQKHANLIQSLPKINLRSKVFLADARKVPLPDSEVDLVITSPPYINVFNYHQHNRTFIDRIYRNALVVAKSEFGANRKHRQNRFLTVIQYVMDMVQAFEEMKRILKHNGRLILVIGRSSKVRGIDFRNDHIIGGVATIAGYKLVAKQERKFVNQYGEKIYEEVLHFTFTDRSQPESLNMARGFAVEILKDAEKRAKGIVRQDIKNAILNVASVNHSPFFSK